MRVGWCFDEKSEFPASRLFILEIVLDPSPIIRNASEKRNDKLAL